MKEKDLLYSRWASQKGTPIIVTKLKYLGLRGWKGHIEKKIINDVEYAGEVYDCITEDGFRIKGIFRVSYEQVKNSKDPVDYMEKLAEDPPNYHTDGIKAYLSGNYRDANNWHLKIEERKLLFKIDKLKHYFETLNNFEHAELRLAIQLYLRRLETPDWLTYKAWKNCTIKHKVIELLND